VRGGFVALRSRESELAAFNALQRTMLWAVALGVVLALVFAFVQAHQITGPVRKLAVATRQVQEGDYSVDIVVKSRDEIVSCRRHSRDWSRISRPRRRSSTT